MGLLHSHTSQPKSSLSYPIGHCSEQYFPRSGQESSERVEGEVVHCSANNSSKLGSCCRAACGNILASSLRWLQCFAEIRPISSPYARLRLNPSIYVHLVWHQREQTCKSSGHFSAREPQEARRGTWNGEESGTYCWGTGTADIHYGLAGNRRGSRWRTGSSFSATGTARG